MVDAITLESTDRYDHTPISKPEHQLVSSEIQDFTEFIKRGWTVDCNDCVTWSALTD